MWTKHPAKGSPGRYGASSLSSYLTNRASPFYVNDHDRKRCCPLTVVKGNIQGTPH